SHPPAPCRWKPGTLSGAGCGYDQQCVAGDVCDLSMATNPAPQCMKGTCTAAFAGTTMCNATTDCDSVMGGQQRVPPAGGMPPTSDGMPICQAPTYGKSGDPCLAGSNLPCQVAFYCGPNNTCVPKLGVMQPCNVGDGSCDDRIHLTCTIPQGGSATACTPL